MIQAVIQGTGSYLPEKRLTNADLEKLVETTDEWILERTGIAERPMAAEEQATSDLAYLAAQQALTSAGVTPEEIDLIIVATVSGDFPFPSVACLLQQRLGCTKAGAFDISATCVGFITAVQIAEQYIKAGKHQHVLVIGAETLSRITDYTDRTTCIIFSDGAGAAVISAQEQSDDELHGLIGSDIGANGEHFSLLYIPGGGTRFPDITKPEHTPKIVMNGNKIFKLAVHAMTDSVRKLLEQTGYSADQIKWVVPHQANKRIIDAVARNLKVPDEKLIVTVKEFANNSSATIPIALDTAVKAGKIQRGDLVVMTAFGGGLVWGSLLVRY
jgi:3-oxoacyl-[acyl-carrier-protein] synthase III